MVDLANGYVIDGDLLNGLVTRQSDGAYLLRLIGFEILLKALLVLSGVTPAHSHRYAALFTALPTDIQKRVSTGAASRFGPNADFADLISLLDELGSNFVAMRYSYSKYGGLSPEEYESRGKEWVIAGSDPDTATFRYHPMELTALIETLRQEISTSIADAA